MLRRKIKCPGYAAVGFNPCFVDAVGIHKLVLKVALRPKPRAAASSQIEAFIGIGYGISVLQHVFSDTKRVTVARETSFSAAPECGDGGPPRRPETAICRLRSHGVNSRI